MAVSETLNQRVIISLLSAHSIIDTDTGPVTHRMDVTREHARTHGTGHATGQANVQYAAAGTITGGSAVTIDLQELIDRFGREWSVSHITAIVIQNKGAGSFTATVPASISAGDVPMAAGATFAMVAGTTAAFAVSGSDIVLTAVTDQAYEIGLVGVGTPAGE